MNEQDRAWERLGSLIGIGLLALGLKACSGVPAYDNYYNPLTNEIHYNPYPPSEKIRIHEETHQRDATMYPLGRIVWSLQYQFSDGFACAAETHANEEAGITQAHPACEVLDISPK